MHISNIWRLGIKELWGLIRSPALLALIVAAFSVQIYAAETAMPETLNKAPISIVDEDVSPPSARITSAFYRPHFNPPQIISLSGMDRRMDAGIDTRARHPGELPARSSGGSAPAMQLNVDATR